MEQPEREPADTGQASYGNSGEQGEGQGPVNGADTMDQEHRGTDKSTSAQRSGGQSDGGKGMGNDSFAGSSLGGQSSSDPAAPPPLDGE